MLTHTKGIVKFTFLYFYEGNSGNKLNIRGGFKKLLLKLQKFIMTFDHCDLCPKISWKIMQFFLKLQMILLEYTNKTETKPIESKFQ